MINNWWCWKYYVFVCQIRLGILWFLCHVSMNSLSMWTIIIFHIYIYIHTHIGYMMFSYSTCMIYACTGHTCTLCTCIPILIYKYLTQWIMVYVFVGKYVNQIMNVTLLDMCDTSQLTYSLMIGENCNE